MRSTGGIRVWSSQEQPATILHTEGLADKVTADNHVFIGFTWHGVQLLLRPLLQPASDPCLGSASVTRLLSITINPRATSGLDNVRLHHIT